MKFRYYILAAVVIIIVAWIAMSVYAAMQATAPLATTIQDIIDQMFGTNSGGNNPTGEPWTPGDTATNALDTFAAIWQTILNLLNIDTTPPP